MMNISDLRTVTMKTMIAAQLCPFDVGSTVDS